MPRSRCERTPNGVRVTRWIIDQPAPPAFVKIGGFTGNVDRWQIIDYTPPSFIRLDVGATPTGTGAPEGRRVGGIQMRNLNAMTPETETTTHYFWAQAHDFEPHNPDMTEKIFQQIKIAFLQDVAVFTAQQRNIELDPDAPQSDINADSGGIQARRIVDRLYQEEQATNGGRLLAVRGAEARNRNPELRYHWQSETVQRHARACRGHPRLAWQKLRRGWPGTSPAMTVARLGFG